MKGKELKPALYYNGRILNTDYCYTIRLRPIFMSYGKFISFFKCPKKRGYGKKIVI